MQLAVERANSVAEAGQAGPLDEDGAADPVVLHLDREAIVARRTITLAFVALACFAMLASASQTTK